VIFKLIAKQEANERRVWQQEGKKDRYAYFGSTGNWTIGDGADMRAGKGAGQVVSAAAEPGALTPNEVKGGWRAAVGGKLVAAPALRVRPATAADKAAAAERVAREKAWRRGRTMAGNRFKVLYDFDAAKESECSVRAGDYVIGSGNNA
jgi:hypothetical protein